MGGSPQRAKTGEVAARTRQNASLVKRGNLVRRVTHASPVTHASLVKRGKAASLAKRVKGASPVKPMRVQPGSDPSVRSRTRSGRSATHGRRIAQKWTGDQNTAVTSQNTA